MEKKYKKDREMERGRRLLVISLIVASIFSGCQTGGSSSNSSTSENVDTKINITTNSNDAKIDEVIERGEGYYIDAPVKGLHYFCSDSSGFTDEEGRFIYTVNRGCIFKVGELTIREIPAEKLNKKRVVIQETDPKVAQFLLSLDKDKSKEQIEIDSAVAKELESQKYKKHISEIDVKTVIEDIKKSLDKKGIKLQQQDVVTLEDARKHLQISFIENENKRDFVAIDESSKPVLEPKEREELANSTQEQKGDNGSNSKKNRVGDTKDYKDNQTKTVVATAKNGSIPDTTESKNSDKGLTKATQKDDGVENRKEYANNQTKTVTTTDKNSDALDSSEPKDGKRDEKTAIEDATKPENGKDAKETGVKKGEKVAENSKKETTQPDNSNDSIKESEDSNKSETEERVTTTLNYDDYIPQGSELTDRMAVKFLNMATFGATPELVAELKSKGVVAWVDEQLNMDFNHKEESILRGFIRLALQIDEKKFQKGNNCSMDDWFKEDSNCHFNQGLGGGRDLMRVHGSRIFNAHLSYKNQLRQRVAYALSQIVVVSQSNDAFFTLHAEALSNYYDILQKDAFKTYEELLYDISLSPAMGVYLSFINNQKAHEDPTTHTTIYPDENYGREIMQLFSIGLFELNMDGTLKRAEGKRVPTYEQKDVMNMSRVFTGLRGNNSKFNYAYSKSDLTRPMVCEMEYHDTEPKEILGHTLQGGADCNQDIKSAISLLINHPNTAPFIAKKLILRLTKSNPTTAYIQRVAQVFKDSGSSLKESVKAVLLDPELWDNIKADRGVKMKEPYVAFIGLLRDLEIKPIPKVSWGKVKLDDNPGFFTNGLYELFGEWPTSSPTVFNFYNDDFTPDDSEFKIRGFVAPESEIFTAGYSVKLINTLKDILYYNTPQVRNATPEEKPQLFASHYIRFSVDYKDVIDVFKKNGFGEELDKGANDSALKKEVTEKVVDYLSLKLLGKRLPDAKRELLVNAYKDAPWPKKGNSSTTLMERKLISGWIKDLAIDIFFSADFMIQ